MFLIFFSSKTNQTAVRHNFKEKFRAVNEALENISQKGLIPTAARNQFDTPIFLAPLHYYKSICRPHLTLTSSFAAKVTGEQLKPEKERWWFPFGATTKASDVIIRRISKDITHKSKAPAVPHEIVIAALHYRLQGIKQLEDEFGFIKRRNHGLKLRFKKKQKKQLSIFEDRIFATFDPNMMLLFVNITEAKTLVGLPMFIKILISSKLRQKIENDKVCTWFCISIAQALLDNKSIVFDLSNILTLCCLIGDRWTFHYLLKFMQQYSIALAQLKKIVIGPDFVKKLLFNGFNFDLRPVKLLNPKRLNSSARTTQTTTLNSSGKQRGRGYSTASMFGSMIVKTKDQVDCLLLPSSCLVSCIITAEFKLAKEIIDLLLDVIYTENDFDDFDNNIKSFIKTIDRSVSWCYKHRQLNTITTNCQMKGKDWYVQQINALLFHFKDKCLK